MGELRQRARELAACREAFDKAGYWPNEVMWKAWQQAWTAANDYAKSIAPASKKSNPHHLYRETLINAQRYKWLRENINNQDLRDSHELLPSNEFLDSVIDVKRFAIAKGQNRG